MPDHVHMCIEIPPKHPVASVIGFLKGKSALLPLPACAARNGTSQASISGLAAMPCPQLGLSWNKSADTSANKTTRMEQAGRSERSTKARLSATPEPTANRL